MDRDASGQTTKYLESLSEDELQRLNLEVLAEQKRAKEALDLLFDKAKRNQPLKLGAPRTRALAGLVWSITQQNNQLAELTDRAAQALEAQEKQPKNRLWRPRKT